LSALALASLGLVVPAPANAATTPIIVATGSQPTWIAFSPDSRTAYVSNRGDDTISVINTATRHVTRTVHLSFTPGILAVSPNGSKIYVIEGGYGTTAIASINTNSFVVTQIVNILNANDVAFSPNGTKAYVTTNDYRFEVLDAVHDDITKEVITNPYPTGVTFSADGTRAYMTTSPSWGDGTITVDGTTDAVISEGGISSNIRLALTNDNARALVATGSQPEIVNLGGWAQPQQMKNTTVGSIQIATASRGSAAYGAVDTTTIPIYDIGANAEVGTLQAPGAVNHVEVRPDSLELWAAMDSLDEVAIFPTPRPTISVVPTRIAGDDRYINSVLIAQAEFNASAPNGGHAPVVYVASGENFPDALSAGPAAVAHGGALLLTPSTFLPTVVRDEIQSLAPSSLVIVGGTGSITPPVRAQLAALVPAGGVTEIAGIDRYVNSRELMDTFWPTSSTDQHGVYVATGANFPDALSAGPAASIQGLPVLLVDGSVHPTDPQNGLDDATKQVLDDHNVVRATVVGGPGSVDDAAMYSLAYMTSVNPGSITRDWGQDRFSASVNTNADAFDAASTVYLASGLKFPDALVGGVLAGASHSALYIVWPDCVPARVMDEINRLKPTKIVILGGTGSLSSAIDSLTECTDGR